MNMTINHRKSALLGLSLAVFVNAGIGTHGEYPAGYNGYGEYDPDAGHIMWSLPHFDLAEASTDNPMPHFEILPEEAELYRMYQELVVPVNRQADNDRSRWIRGERKGPDPLTRGIPQGWDEHGYTYMRNITQFDVSRALTLLARKYAEYAAYGHSEAWGLPVSSPSFLWDYIRTHIDQNRDWMDMDVEIQRTMFSIDGVGLHYWISGMGVLRVGGMISPTRTRPMQYDSPQPHPSVFFPATTQVFGSYWSEEYNARVRADWVKSNYQVPDFDVGREPFLRTYHPGGHTLLVADTAEEAWDKLVKHRVLGTTMGLRGAENSYTFEGNYVGIGFFPGQDYPERQVVDPDGYYGNYKPHRKGVWVILVANSLANPDDYLWKPSWVRAVMNGRNLRGAMNALEGHRRNPYPNAEVVEGDRLEGLLHDEVFGYISTLGGDNNTVYFHNGLGYVSVRSLEHPVNEHVDWSGLSREIYRRERPLEDWVMPGSVHGSMWSDQQEIFPDDPRWDKTVATTGGSRQRWPEMYDLWLSDPNWMAPLAHLYGPDEEPFGWDYSFKYGVSFVTDFPDDMPRAPYILYWRTSLVEDDTVTIGKFEHQDRRFLYFGNPDFDSIHQLKVDPANPYSQGGYLQTGFDVYFHTSTKSEGFWGYSHQGGFMFFSNEQAFPWLYDVQRQEWIWFAGEYYGMRIFYSTTEGWIAR